MINLAQLTEADFEKMAQEIQEISETQSEDSLLESLGNALHDSGLTISTANSFEILQPKAFNEATEKFSLKKSISFVADRTPITTSEAKEEGRKFWQRFKDKLRSAICNDPKIKELLEGDGSLKDYLIAGIPLILSALGIGALNPLALAIVAAVVALIVKVGFQTYCENA
jgi:hypothetical protein